MTAPTRRTLAVILWAVVLSLVWWSAARSQGEPPPYDPERAWYADQAALLDPRAYEFVSSHSWSRTVPEGETWYALNLWRVRWQELTLGGFLRTPDANRPLLLPSGTLLRSYTGTTGDPSTAFAYLCRPQAVFDIDARYTEDPKALYWARKDRLRSLPLREINGRVGGGSAWNTTVLTPFPATFDYGLAVEVSVYDAPWVGLAAVSETGSQIVCNLQPEINNNHTTRNAGVLCMPFSRARFPSIATHGGNNAGDSSSPCVLGLGQVLYVELPGDW